MNSDKEMKQQAADVVAKSAKMPNRVWNTWFLLLLPLFGATALGLLFLWHCPDLPLDVSWCRNEHLRFWCQLAWTFLGWGVYMVALKVGWAKWLKAGAFVFGGWLMFLVIVRFLLPQFKSNLHLPGWLDFDSMTMMPFALALLLAWVVMRFKVRIRTVALCLYFVVVLLCVVKVMTSRDGMERIKRYLRGDTITDVGLPAQIRKRDETQRRTSSLLADSKWFEGSDVASIRNLPGVATYSMPATSAVLFGRWFLAAVVLMWLGFAGSLLSAWRVTKDKPKRMFLLVGGLGILIPVVAGPCECMRILPMACTCIPIVSYGGALTCFTWLIAGVLTSMVGTKEEVFYESKIHKGRSD